MEPFDTLIDLLEQRASDPGPKAVVHLRHHGGEPERLTYAAIRRRAGGVAQWLRDEGVLPGERLVIALPTGADFIATLFGSLLAGIVPVPLSPPFSLRKTEMYEQTMSAIVRDCRAAACVSTGRVLMVLRGCLRRANPRLKVLTPPRPTRRRSSLTPCRPGPDATAFIQYTSGSTSAPKGVVLSHANILANLSAIQQALDTRPGDCAVSWLPLYHDMGLIGMLLGSLYCNAPLVLMPPEAFLRDPSRWLRAISEHRGTVTTAPNFAYGYCARRAPADRLDGVRLDSLRVALNGAEPVNHEAAKRFVEEYEPLGLRNDVVRPVYGLAESCLAVTFSEPGRLIIDEVDTARLGPGVGGLDHRTVPP